MELPLLLAGPILRRVETTLATVWIALSEEATVRLLVWEGSVEAGAGGQPFVVSSHQGEMTWRIGDKHTMEGNLPHTDALFTPTPERSGNSAHFGTAQDGTVIQWVQLGVVAFHALDANFHWYAVENADNGDPNNPYTDAQLSRIAQILELTSRPEYGRFALQVTDSPDQEGLGTHHMGGAAWGAHSCPDADKRPNHTRSRARAEIVRRAMIIRQHGPPDQHFNKIHQLYRDAKHGYSGCDQSHQDRLHTMESRLRPVQSARFPQRRRNRLLRAGHPHL